LKPRVSAIHPIGIWCKTVEMDAVQRIAIGSLLFAALITTLRNLYGQPFVEAWFVPLLVAITVPYLIWVEYKKRSHAS